MSDNAKGLKYGVFGGVEGGSPNDVARSDSLGTKNYADETEGHFAQTHDPDPFDVDSEMEVLENEKEDDADLHLYKNFVCVVGRLHFKDTLKIRQGAFGDYAVFSLYIESPGKDYRRKYYLFIKAFDPRIVEWLKQQPNGTFIKIYGNLEAFNGSMYIKARDIFPVMDADQVTNNVIGEPSLPEQKKQIQEEVEYLRDRLRAFGVEEDNKLRVGDREVPADETSGLMLLDNSDDEDSLAYGSGGDSGTIDGLSDMDKRLRMLARQVKKDLPEGMYDTSDILGEGEEEADDIFLDEEEDDEEFDAGGDDDHVVKPEEEELREIRDTKERMKDFLEDESNLDMDKATPPSPPASSSGQEEDMLGGFPEFEEMDRKNKRVPRGLGKSPRRKKKFQEGFDDDVW